MKASELYETIDTIGRQDNPAATNQPSTSGNQPSTSGNQPSTSGNRPSTSGNQPSTSDNQPSTSGLKQSPTKSGNSNGVLVNPKQVCIYCLFQIKYLRFISYAFYTLREVIRCLNQLSMYHGNIRITSYQTM